MLSGSLISIGLLLVHVVLIGTVIYIIRVIREPEN